MVCARSMQVNIVLQEMHAELPGGSGASRFSASAYQYAFLRAHRQVAALETNND